MAVETIPLGRFLFERIAQLGVKSIIGVPGDMNLELLDYIDEVEGMSWIGTANELGAAYACDGYARIKEAPGVLITTMGVGELSALNGVAGAFTENVKLIHIVGTTSTGVQKKRAMIHHSLGPNPDHRVFDKISTHVRTAHCWLDDETTAPDEIDRVIRQCYLDSLPVYIFVPMDFVYKKVNKHRLSEEIDLEPRSEQHAVDKAVAAVHSALAAARKPAVLVDALTSRFRATEIAQKLITQLQFPTFSTSMGKAIVDESTAYYHGTYNGKVCPPWMHEYIEKESDLVLELGPLLSDSNTGGHSREIAADKLISVHPDMVICFSEKFANVHINTFLLDLSKALQDSPLPTRYSLPPASMANPVKTQQITQDYIWHRIAAFSRAGDIVIAESGTAQFGFPDVTFPRDVTYVTQVYYGSIGYSVGSCLGAAVAKREQGSNGRVILVVGDGSLQLTVQEVGTMIRQGFTNIILMVINNRGYTIERAIHGPTKEYNDISTWNHQLMLSFFGHTSGQQCSRQAHTRSELETILGSSEYTTIDKIQLLEIHMDVMDIPWRLRDQIALVKSRQAQPPAN